jgi:hypothetical protein
MHLGRSQISAAEDVQDRSEECITIVEDLQGFCVEIFRLCPQDGNVFITVEHLRLVFEETHIGILGLHSV